MSHWDTRCDGCLFRYSGLRISDCDTPTPDSCRWRRVEATARESCLRATIRRANALLLVVAPSRAHIGQTVRCSDSLKHHDRGAEIHDES